MNNRVGKSKEVLKHLGFLVKEYNMQFKAQAFEKYLGSNITCYTYSFYNSNGCFTMEDVALDGIGLYVSKVFSENYEELFEQEIIQPLYPYLQGSCWLFRTFIKKLAKSIRYQIATSGEFFGVRIKVEK